MRSGLWHLPVAIGVIEPTFTELFGIMFGITVDETVYICAELFLLAITI